MEDVQHNGLDVARHLRGDVYEVRADGRNATCRVLFATEDARGRALPAVSAFAKMTRETPQGQIALAATTARLAITRPPTLRLHPNGQLRYEIRLAGESRCVDGCS